MLCAWPLQTNLTVHAHAHASAHISHHRQPNELREAYWIYLNLFKSKALRADEQEVLAIIQQALPGFDAVCMATAAHKMGSLPSEPGPSLARHPAIMDLGRAIGNPCNVWTGAGTMWIAAWQALA